MPDRDDQRLTWNGLFRILGRKKDLNFGHEQIKAYIGGKKIYLNISFGQDGYPYFREIRQKKDRPEKERKDRYENQNHRVVSNKKPSIHRWSHYQR